MVTVDPPAHAVVLSVDEKSRNQALDRIQLPVKKGRAGTMTDDYKRHGTTTCSGSGCSQWFNGIKEKCGHFARRGISMREGFVK